MLIGNKYSFQSHVPWQRPVFWVSYSAIIASIYVLLNINIDIPLAVPAILGTAVSLFLGFRTNSAYQRWWEARKIWGAITNNSRTLARQILTFGNAFESVNTRNRIIKRQIAWNWTLAYSLRNLGNSDEAEEYLNPDELMKIQNSKHPNNILLLNQEKDLSSLVEGQALNEFDFRTIDSTLKELTDSMGKCERIKKTVFPTQYSLYTAIFINLFLALLPFGLVPVIGFFTLPVHFSIGFTFGMIQRIAEDMQDPFEGTQNDTAMFTMSRGIEQNLLEMMGEKELPEAYPVKDGVMM